MYLAQSRFSKLHSTVRLFADDTTSYLVIESPEDATLLQEDHVTLSEWEEQWRMKFHRSKCTKVTVTNKRSPIKTDYNLYEHILASVQFAKYLGLTITEDLKWDTPMQNI